MAQTEAYTLSKLSGFIVRSIAANQNLQNVWVVGETVDVRTSGGHCYLELVEKDEASGRPLARMRCTIWASTFGVLAHKFRAATGQNFGSNQKVMVCVCVNYHPLYGLAGQIVDIHPEYTAGDAMRRRAEMIERLKKDGIIDMNRQLPWPIAPQRIAVISAKGAAGYGDFINQLLSNSALLRFECRLFEAVMQGENAAPSIIGALNVIAAMGDAWDCVVIIRGGGATSDLACFDNYDLAANIAQFPIPVIIGIGHERDITLLDYVANMRVKTPTAAAEWLIQRGESLLGRLQYIATAMLQAVTDRMSGCHRQLAYIEGQLPAAARAALVRANNRLVNSQAGLASIADRRLRPEMAKLDGIAAALKQAAAVAIDRQRTRLQGIADMLGVLSPQATLKRGYSITRIDGHAITSAAEALPGAVITTTLASGTITSTVTPTNQS